MSDDPSRSEHDDGTDGSGLTTAEYLQLTMLNRVSLLGVAVAAVGAAVVMLTSPGGPLPLDAPLLGGGLFLAGALVFALGFSIGQRTLGSREDW
jgi:drug/metabolite transporter (DMT)-like permease